MELEKFTGRVPNLVVMLDPKEYMAYEHNAIKLLKNNHEITLSPNGVCANLAEELIETFVKIGLCDEPRIKDRRNVEQNGRVVKWISLKKREPNRL